MCFEIHFMGEPVKKAAIVFGIVFGALTSATATEVEQRYSISRTTDGYVRTDVTTGQISVCTEQGDQLICRMAPDERQAYEADIAALQLKIDSLEKRIAELEKPITSGSAANPPAQDEQEFQTSLDRMEQFFRRFMGIVKEFQAFGTETPPIPDKT
ncbi:MAG: hypothetical protein ACRCT6_12935 [Notoacmeibacter sp.]